MATYPSITDETDPMMGTEPIPEMSDGAEESAESPESGPEEEMDEEVEAALKSIIERAKLNEVFFRQGQLQTCKKYQLFWRGYQFIYWSEVARDFQGPQLYNDNINLDPELSQDINNFTKVINIFKAHGESMIGALSTATPSVRFPPEDINNADDIVTGAAKTRISEMIQEQNNAPMLFVKALYLLWNYGYVAAYTRHHSDPKYGTVQVPIMGEQEQVVSSQYCPVCSLPIESDRDETGAMMPPDTEATIPDIEQDTQSQFAELGAQVCPNCGASSVPMQQDSLESVPAVVGQQEVPKGRELIELYGPLNITIPATAKRQEDVGYLFLEDEYHYAQVRAIFPEYWEKIQPGGGWDLYERWARHLTGLESLQEQVTVRQVWLRPFMFWTIDDEEIRNKLFAEFPSGVCCVLCNDELLEATEESLDDHWTLTINPTEESIGTSEPLGRPLMPIQETTNEAFNIILQQMQYGIADTFADPDVINFKEYAKTANTVGMIYPAKSPNPGKAIGDYFHQFKAATMSKELDAFLQKLEGMGQFVIGTFPSIFGGPQGSGSSKTLGEYEQSRNQALQRLSLPWKMINEWWSTVMSKAVALYIDNMLEDEKYTKASGNAYVTSWIRKSQLTGRTGRVIAETSEQFPLSWAQKGAMIFKLIGLQDPNLNQTIFNPENIDFTAKTFGLSELKMPGEADRLKQMSEINQLLNGEMIMPDEMLDNHAVEAEVCRNWLISLVGQDAKISNPMGFHAVYQHFTLHQQVVQMQMAAQQQMAAQAAGPGEGDQSGENGNQ